MTISAGMSPKTDAATAAEAVPGLAGVVPVDDDENVIEIVEVLFLLCSVAVLLTVVIVVDVFIVVTAAVDVLSVTWMLVVSLEPNVIVVVKTAFLVVVGV